MKIKTNLDQVNSALQSIANAGGRVRINDSAGSFSVKGVSGRFSFDQEDEILTIAIDDMPFFASRSMVENKILKFFNQ